MNSQEQLRELIVAQQERLSASFPLDLPAAVDALTHARDSLYLTTERADSCVPPSDLAEKQRLYTLGWNKALELCLRHAQQKGGMVSPFAGGAVGEWADHVLRECGRLGEAEQVLAHCETGYMQVQRSSERTFDAWAATRLKPADLREREDYEWWAASLARSSERELQELMGERPRVQKQLQVLAARGDTAAEMYATGDPYLDEYYRRLGRLYLQRMACQYTYPPDAVIGGCSFHLYLEVAALLIGWMLQHLDLCAARGERDTANAGGWSSALRSESALVHALAAALRQDTALIRLAVLPFVLDGENAAYHAARPGAAAPPLIRLDGERLAWSAVGLLTEPLLFATRELRRRYAQDYHNTAHLREERFRQDLYALFGDRRFVTSPRTIKLERDGGGLRTDLDAIVFDRKAGALGIFELKSQDPFARSTEERERQRDNFYHANRQVSAALQWLRKNDATSLLARVDTATAKRFKVHKVYIFVLGRYLAHFDGGPQPDRRAAWGSWPQVLRLVGEQPFSPSAASPISSLFNRLSNDVISRHEVGQASVREIEIGDVRLRVHPSFAAYRGGQRQLGLKQKGQ